MKIYLAIALLAIAGCKPARTVTANFVQSRPDLSLTGNLVTICTFTFSDAFGEHKVEKTLPKDGKCPAKIQVEI